MTDKASICRPPPSADPDGALTAAWVPGWRQAPCPHPALCGEPVNASHLSLLPSGDTSTEYIYGNTPTVLQANLSAIAQAVHLKTV